MPRFVFLLGLLLIALLLLGVPSSFAADQSARPNLLVIFVDDLNDWVGPFGGHPLTRTPHINRLAREGTTFLNAHCQAPLCNPSRTSLLLGLRPTRTGIYGLSPSFRALDEFRDFPTWPQLFHQAGYRTLIAGKVFHHSFSKEDRFREADVWGPPASIGARPPHKLVPPTPMGNHPLVDWGPLPNPDSDFGDHQLATWSAQQIHELPTDQPWLMMTGFFLPHVPCYSPQRSYDLFPDSDDLLPKILESDREDVPRFAWYLHWELPEPRLKWVRESDQWRNLTRSYLASISFMDEQVGRLLTALDETGKRENTIVALIGDHGWHLGEKGITGKNTLWERSTRVPLIFRGPGIPSERRSNVPCELLDLFPTLAELAGVPLPAGRDGSSLAGQFADSPTADHSPALTTHNPGNHAVRSEHWRYIRYADGSEELYDHRNDPHEWINVAPLAESDPIIADHRRWLPTAERPHAPNSSGRTLTYDPLTGSVIWESKAIPMNSSVPE